MIKKIISMLIQQSKLLKLPNITKLMNILTRKKMMEILFKIVITNLTTEIMAMLTIMNFTTMKKI